MNRIAKWSLAAALGVMALAGAARAEDEDNIKALLADCSSPNIERDDIDSCLERARELSETAPSTLLQGLTARLERRAEILDEGDSYPPKDGETHAAGSAGAPPAVAATDSSQTAAPH
jgi:hypothetical protein